jgi:hypothetical protein
MTIVSALYGLSIYILSPYRRGDMDRLAGRIALVTGASKGIGAGIAKNLGAEGAITGQLIQAAGGVTI